MNDFEKTVDSRPNIKIKFVTPPNNKFGGCVKKQTVYLNRELSYQERYQWLQEEFAHLDFTVGNITKEQNLDSIKQENLARSKAMERTVTLDGLIDCFKSELWTPGEIADYFEVTVPYLRDALENYRIKRGLIFKYHGYYFDFRNNVNISKI